MASVSIDRFLFCRGEAYLSGSLSEAKIINSFNLVNPKHNKRQLRILFCYAFGSGGSGNSPAPCLQRFVTPAGRSSRKTQRWHRTPPTAVNARVRRRIPREFRDRSPHSIPAHPRHDARTTPRAESNGRSSGRFRSAGTKSLQSLLNAENEV